MLFGFSHLSKCVPSYLTTTYNMFVRPPFTTEYCKICMHIYIPNCNIAHDLYRCLLTSSVCTKLHNIMNLFYFGSNLLCLHSWQYSLLWHPSKKRFSMCNLIKGTYPSWPTDNCLNHCPMLGTLVHTSSCVIGFVSVREPLFCHFIVSHLCRMPLWLVDMPLHI